MRYKKHGYTHKQSKQKLMTVKELGKKLGHRIHLLIIGGSILILLLGFWLYYTKNKATPLMENTFYSAIYMKTPVLFYKYEGMVSGLQPIGPTEGQFIQYANNMSPMMMNRMMQAQYVDFRKLQYPKRLFTFDRYATIENIQLSPDNTYLVMSIVGGKSDDTNYIYQVNLKTSSSQKIWEHKLRTGHHPLNKGFAYVTGFLPDRFVTFDIIQGNPPPTAMPQGTVIVNMQTGVEKILGIVGDTSINISKNVVSYKNLGNTSVPCEGKYDPVCFPGDTLKYNYTPVGPILTQPLP